MGHYASEMDPNWGKGIPSKEEMDARGYALDDDKYKFIGRIEKSLSDSGTMVWMCRRDGAVIAHQELHEKFVHK